MWENMKEHATSKQESKAIADTACTYLEVVPLMCSNTCRNIHCCTLHEHWQGNIIVQLVWRLHLHKLVFVHSMAVHMWISYVSTNIWPWGCLSETVGCWGQEEARPSRLPAHVLLTCKTFLYLCFCISVYLFSVSCFCVYYTFLTLCSN